MKRATPMNSLCQNGSKAHANLILITILMFVAVGLCGGVQAQTFQTIPSLSFTMPFGGANPLPQIVTPASTGAAFNFYQQTSTSNGGNWLSAPNCNNADYPCATPNTVAVVVSASGLAAGTYQGQIKFTDEGNSSTMTVAVTLTVAQTSAPFFDNLPGGLTFFLKSGSTTPTAQPFQIRNAGTGTLSWTLSTSTASSNNWITASATSGTAPAAISIGINTAHLPSGAGTYVGQVLLTTSGDSTTIPITITVGTSIFDQVNPLNFTMPVGGAAPLAQLISTAYADNSSHNFFQTTVTANGGNWLSAPNCNNSDYPCASPNEFQVAIQNVSSLAAGFYMGQVTVYQDTDPEMAINIPVTLNIVASGTFFNNLPGGLAFTFVPGDKAPSQTVTIGNAGSGSLSWTATTSTSDGGAWLSVSPASGTAPSEASVSITPANLPGGGSVAGTYVGQVLLQTTGDTTSIPVVVVVGTNVFNQVNPISFTMPVGGANPLPQNITIATTGSSVNFYQASSAATGGNWLSVPNCNNADYPCATPNQFAVNVQNASTLPAGTYEGEIAVYEDTDPSMSLNIPVTLNVEPSGAFFNNLPGGLTFTLVPNGPAVTQTIPITNGGSGTLSWTATTATSDGNAWLSTSPTSGSTPDELSVKVEASLLPNGGQLAGTYTGQVFLQTGTDTTTIPVNVTVATDGFNQINPISFTMPAGGAAPLPQILTMSTTGTTSVNFYQVTTAATGGNWLSAPSCNNADYPCATPNEVTVNVQNASSLPAGVYTGEVVFYWDTDPSSSVAVPVTLNVVGSGAFFNNLPGQLSFTMPQGAKTVTPQNLQIGNAGSGKLKFTITPSTADGGAWLTASALSGSAPKTVSVEIDPKNLPSAGAIAGTYQGQLLLQTGADSTTVPVTVVVADNAFTQVNPINFVMPAGGANPLPQIITVATINDTSLNFYQVTANATGGNWLSVPSCNNSDYPCATPNEFLVSVTNTNDLAAGTYVGQVTIYWDADPSWSITVPVTLTVVADTKAFFDELPGQASFSFAPGTTKVQSQTIYLGNGGEGTLDWSIKTSTADTGKWLKVTPTKGVNSGSFTVEVTPKNLPNKGAIAGTFLGHQVLSAKTGVATIPVIVNVSDQAFVPVPTVVFNTSQGGTPPPQTVTIASSGANMNFYQVTSTGKGNDWLPLTSCNNADYPCATPTNLTLSVVSSGLPVGSYYAEINIFEDTDPSQSMTIEVVLNVVN
jgi:Viral BACON domain